MADGMAACCSWRVRRSMKWCASSSSYASLRGTFVCRHHISSSYVVVTLHIFVVVRHHHTSLSRVIVTWRRRHTSHLRWHTCRCASSSCVLSCTVACQGHRASSSSMSCVICETYYRQSQGLAPKVQRPNFLLRAEIQTINFVRCWAINWQLLQYQVSLHNSVCHLLPGSHWTVVTMSAQHSYMVSEKKELKKYSFV